MSTSDDLIKQAAALFSVLDELPLETRIDALNRLRRLLRTHSPFAEEPTDCVQWVRADLVRGNTYNPNVIAPPEMRLLQHSIRTDGYTQPIVTHLDKAGYEVVDGFHRQKVGRSVVEIRKRLHGYLPVVVVRPGRDEMSDRIAATIRHNRARGLHTIEPMTDVVKSLLQTGWTDARIAQELGMDADELFRFKRATCLPELFCGNDFSRSWR